MTYLGESQNHLYLLLIIIIESSHLLSLDRGRLGTFVPSTTDSASVARIVPHIATDLYFTVGFVLLLIGGHKSGRGRRESLLFSGFSFGCKDHFDLWLAGAHLLTTILPFRLDFKFIQESC